MTHFPAALAAAAAAAEASPPDEAVDAAAAAAADPGPAKHSGNTIIVQTTYTEHTAGLKVFGECTLMPRDMSIWQHTNLQHRGDCREENVWRVTRICQVLSWQSAHPLTM